VRIYRLTNKGGTGNWVAAHTEVEAIDYFVKRGRARKAENVKAIDATDGLAAANANTNLGELMLSLTSPAFLAISVGPLPSLLDVINTLQADAPSPEPIRKWTTW
jgi:hypothetical protein